MIHLILFHNKTSKDVGSIAVQDDRSPGSGPPSFYSPVYGLKPRSGECIRWLLLLFNKEVLCTLGIFKVQGSLRGFFSLF